MGSKTADRYDAFARAYIQSLNATDAAIKAGYSEKTAYSQGQRLLKKVEIQDRLQKLRDEAQKRAEITLDDILNEYKKIAFGGMSKFIRVTQDGDPQIDLSNCTPEDLDLLAEATVEDFTEGRGEDARDVRRIKIKPMDRLKALETLGKHLGLGNKTQDDSINNLADAFRKSGVVPESMPIATAKKQ